MRRLDSEVASQRPVGHILPADTSLWLTGHFGETLFDDLGTDCRPPVGLPLPLVVHLLSSPEAREPPGKQTGWYLKLVSKDVWSALLRGPELSFTVRPFCSPASGPVPSQDINCPHHRWGMKGKLSARACQLVTTTFTPNLLVLILWSSHVFSLQALGNYNLHLPKDPEGSDFPRS